MIHEKAKELVKAMHEPIFDIDNGINVLQDKLRYDAAVKCAIITVNEILEATKQDCARSTHAGFLYDIYWQQVKDELKKMLIDK